MTGHEPVIRHATIRDAAAVADVYIDSYRATYAFPLAHPEADVRRWLHDRLGSGTETWVAVTASGDVVAMMMLTDDMLDQLYVAPGHQGSGIGDRLVALAKVRRPNGLDLFTFQVNARARGFYERRGFRAVAFGDGSGNEEGEPDVRYAWRP